MPSTPPGRSRSLRSAPMAKTTAKTAAVASATPDAAASGVMAQLRATDLRGVARLAAQATVGISRVAEGVHQSVLGTLGLPGGETPGTTRGLTGLVYQSIRGVTRLVDAGLQAGLARLEPFFASDGPDAHGAVQWERQAVIAALNGVMGDRLEADGNPLCTHMGWYQQGLPIDARAPGQSGAASGKLLVMVHGLCMNDLQWRTQGHDHGEFLARELGYTPVYLRYNTGLHTSVNGAGLSAALDALVAGWPVPVTEVAVLAHSMGGLVARSAERQARQASLRWRGALRDIVLLGTPNEGAPLERLGHAFERVLGRLPFAHPFTRIGALRSRGILDLRDGLHDAEGLPTDLRCYTVAASLARTPGRLDAALLGDGLVPVESALGRRALGRPADDALVVPGTGHLQLLRSLAVRRQLSDWLTAG